MNDAVPFYPESQGWSHYCQQPQLFSTCFSFSKAWCLDFCNYGNCETIFKLIEAIFKTMIKLDMRAEGIIVTLSCIMNQRTSLIISASNYYNFCLNCLKKILQDIQWQIIPPSLTLLLSSRQVYINYINRLYHQLCSCFQTAEWKPAVMFCLIPFTSNKAMISSSKYFERFRHLLFSVGFSPSQLGVLQYFA